MLTKKYLCKIKYCGKLLPVDCMWIHTTKQWMLSARLSFTNLQLLKETLIMLFHEQLNYYIDLYHISGKELAKNINISEASMESLSYW